MPLRELSHSSDAVALAPPRGLALHAAFHITNCPPSLPLALFMQHGGDLLLPAHHWRPVLLVVGWLNLLGQVRLEWVGGCRRAAWFACLPAGLPACLLSQLLPGGC